MLLAIALTFVMLVIPMLGSKRIGGYGAIVAVLLAIVQNAIEGSRWQLVPGYLLLGSLCLLWASRNFRRAKATPTTSQRHPFIVGTAIALGAVAMAISVALPIVLPVFVFPRPVGPYALGTVTYHWIDASRPEVFGKPPRAARELMVQIWYPADQRKMLAPYVDDAAILSAALGQLHDTPAFLFDHLKYVNTNASSSVPVAKNRPRYPVLIFLEGITGFRQMNTYQVEELVSQGYIVVAIDQPYVAASVVFPGGRAVTGLSKNDMDPLIQQNISPSTHVPTLDGQAFANGIIPYLAQDVAFTIDRLTVLNGATSRTIMRGKLDMESVGIFGVSLGGIVVGEACRTERRLKACLVMDAPMPSIVTQSGLDKPGMWITRDPETMRTEGWAEPDVVQHQQTMWRAFDRSRNASYFVQVRGMFHANLTDAPLFSPLTPRLGITGPIDGRRAHTIINAYSLAFFDRHLRGKTALLLDGNNTRFPEVALDKRRQSER